MFNYENISNIESDEKCNMIKLVYFEIVSELLSLLHRFMISWINIWFLHTYGFYRCARCSAIFVYIGIHWRFLLLQIFSYSNCELVFYVYAHLCICIGVRIGEAAECMPSSKVVKLRKEANFKISIQDIT